MNNVPMQAWNSIRLKNFDFISGDPEAFDTKRPGIRNPRPNPSELDNDIIVVAKALLIRNKSNSFWSKP